MILIGQILFLFDGYATFCLLLQRHCHRRLHMCCDYGVDTSKAGLSLGELIRQIRTGMDSFAQERTFGPL